MKLPKVQPFVENMVCGNSEEFSKLLRESITLGKGAVLKIFGKIAENPYYITLLVDDEKTLAVEAQEVSSGEILTGNDAMDILNKLLSSVVIVDAYPLDEVEIKTSIVDNIDLYAQTPKIDIDSIASPAPQVKAEEYPIPVPEEAPAQPVQKPKKMELELNVPPDFDPYFRVLVNHLKSEGKSMGLEFERVEVDAKEVRYALGAGSGIHATLKIKASADKEVNRRIVKERIESRAYKEAGELSKEIGKRIVISKIELQL